MIEPKLFSILKLGKREMGKKQLANDIVAGIIVAIIALPLSVALGISSGVTPEKGLITAIVAGFIISFFGGSRVQIGGPTGAFVVIVYGIIEKYGITGLTIATIMAGVILILMGVLKVGSMIKYIPYTITTGFTAGIAVTLLSTQVKDFLGLNIDKVPSEFIPKWIAYISNISTLQGYTLLIGVISLLIMIYWPKINKTIPGSLVALFVATLAVKALSLPVETIGDRFGEISASIHIMKMDTINLNTITELIHPAITIAILGGIESLLSAVVADGMIGKKHDSNMELIAQGVANIVSPVFGGIPATGAIARTAANVKSGGRTPIAGVVHAVVLFLIMVIFMPLAKLIPMTTLGAILIIVAYNMSHVKEFKLLLKAPKGDVAVLLVTFLLTVVFDLVVAIEIGMVIAMFLFIRKMAKHTSVINIQGKHKFSENVELGKEILANENIEVYQINGPLFFGAAQSFMDTMNNISDRKEVIILRMFNVPIIDATAYDVLKKINERCKKNDTKLIFSEVNEYPMKVMETMGLVRMLGNDKFFDSIDDALLKTKEIIETAKIKTA